MLSRFLSMEIFMPEVSDPAGLADELAAPFNAIVCRHRAALMPMLGGSESVARAALANDDAVRKVLSFAIRCCPGYCVSRSRNTPSSTSS
jgi:hypothetical protein